MSGVQSGSPHVCAGFPVCNGLLLLFLQIIADGSRKTWAGMVLWALAAAYSHYYALVAVGIMMFFTGVAVWIKYRGKTWIKGVLAIVAFFIGYAPGCISSMPA